MKILLKKLFLSICLMLLLSFTNADSLTDYLREKYDELPEKGKFATGAAVGFGVSRVAIKSAVGVVKVAGAAFIASEVLNAAGAFDNIPEFSSEQSAMAGAVKARALNLASGFRKTIRKRCNPDNLKSLMETDRMATMGAAAGAFAGFLI